MSSPFPLDSCHAASVYSLDSCLEHADLKTAIGIISALLLFGCRASVPYGDGGSLHRLEGSIRGNEYVGPDGLFRVDVPVMYNPFVKEPSEIGDERRTDGGAEVNFAVTDLGEAWRFGVRPDPRSGGGSLQNHERSRSHDLLAAVCDEELRRWHDEPGGPRPVLEEKSLPGDPDQVVRIYYVESGSLLHAGKGDSDPKRLGALVGVLVKAPIEFEGMMFVVGQFDMPNYEGHFTLETEAGRAALAREQLRRLRELSVSLRAP